MLGFTSNLVLSLVLAIVLPNLALGEPVPITNAQGVRLGAMVPYGSGRLHGELWVDNEGLMFFRSCDKPPVEIRDIKLIQRTSHNCTYDVAQWPPDLYALFATDWSGIISRGQESAHVPQGPIVGMPTVPEPIRCPFCTEGQTSTTLDRTRLIINSEKYSTGGLDLKKYDPGQVIQGIKKSQELQKFQKLPKQFQLQRQFGQ